MDKKRALESAIWAVGHLNIRPTPSDTQIDDWAIVAMEFTDRQWTEGVRAHYRKRPRDFEPPLDELREEIIATCKKLGLIVEVIQDRPLPYDGWEPPFPEDSAANSLANRLAYQEHLEAVRGKSEGISLREWNQGKIMRFPRGGDSVSSCG